MMARYSFQIIQVYNSLTFLIKTSYVYQVSIFVVDNLILCFWKNVLRTIYNMSDSSYEFIGEVILKINVV
jgi:hypothetical protein